jgi:methylglutaconyl-CoA hydratase
MTHLQVHRDPREVAWLTLDRPDVRNAFNAELIAELAEAAAALAADPPRALVIAGNGPSFSAGADLAWMRGAKDLSWTDNLADARATSAMFRALDALPCAVIGRVHGHALGGGVGLVAVCDIVVAEAGTIFGFTEVRLGIAPAVISPFVVRKIGRSHARALFTTGERFDAARAERIGLVHVTADAGGLDDAVEAAVASVLAAGPAAVAAAKRLPELASAPLDEAAETTAAVIADLRTSDEGQEGMEAFLEKRAPRWTR